MMYEVFKKLVMVVLVCFQVVPIQPAFGDVVSLPAPGQRMALSNSFNPPLLKGLRIYQDDPFRLDFILNHGETSQASSKDAERLIKYFLASLTVPENEQWVNLSPYEKDRVIPQALGQTEMGRDLLAQDYLLKQISASLLYPEQEIGKKYWKKVYELAYQKYGVTDIPVESFHKVWILPDKAVLYQKGNTVYIVESSLRVMMEEDYLALTQKNKSSNSHPGKDIAASIMKEMMLPLLTQEINEGTSFATVRQVYQSFILASWYKQQIHQNLIAASYVDKNKIPGIQSGDERVRERIYQQYLEAFRKGVYNYIKEEVDPVSQQTIPRKYFSGGVGLAWKAGEQMMEFAKELPRESTNFPSSEVQVRLDRAMTSEDGPEDRIKYARELLTTLVNVPDVQADSYEQKAVENAQKILDLPYADEIFKHIPQGSLWLGYGTYSLVLLTPDSFVLRIEKTTSSREDIKGLLQPSSETFVGEYRIEWLQKAEMTGITMEELVGLEEKLNAQGWMLGDMDLENLDNYNVGRVGGELMVIDPDAILPLDEEGSWVLLGLLGEGPLAALIQDLKEEVLESSSDNTSEENPEIKVKDDAVLVKEENVGGVDFNRANLDMRIEGEASSSKHPLWDPALIVNPQMIQGFTPVIIKITPLDNVPMFLGMQKLPANRG